MTLLSIQIFCAFLIPLACSSLLMPFIIRFATAQGLFDLPDRVNHSDINHDGGSAFFVQRRVHTMPTPRLGGVAIVLGFFITELFFSFRLGLSFLFLSSFAIFILGLLDDLRPISAKSKFVVQILIALSVVVFYDLSLQELSLTSFYSIPLSKYVGLPLAVFIVVGAINAINMIDGLDGLAGGITVIAVTVLSYIYFFQTKDVNFLIHITLPIIGATLGFLRFNTYPASVFMGDGGSNWLGFMVGFLILLILNDHHLVQVGSLNNGMNFLNLNNFTAKTPLLSALSVLSLPILDTAHVMALRLKNGLSPMAPDNRHFHHTLLRVGLSHSQSVITIYFISLLSGILGVFPIAFHNYSFWWAPYVAFFGVTLGVFLPLDMEYFLKKIRNVEKRKYLLSNKLNNFFRFWELLNRYSLYSVVLISPLLCGVISPHIGYMALFSIFIIIFSMFWHKKNVDFMDSFVLAIAGSVVLMANNQNLLNIEILGQKHQIQYFYNAIFVGIFFSNILYIAFTFKKRDFLFTPSDFLLITFPLVIILVPDPYNTNFKINAIALKCFILFLGIRSMGKRKRYFISKVRLITLISLLYIVSISLLGFRITY